ncbi:BlaI/MecI/CopY family transcriptional regulator [Emticicia sp. CRIBPO]|uniref:BlaI/MecI/CopY family transcriptional regulator n=1 Tax=Emticicia sp. CRIBPO TaxID=2683258 RepID=UPI00197ACB9C|nr:BlaI/MecI/CopY family transcriptional regulator [Emticicia sp. CRIBPO]
MRELTKAEEEIMQVMWDLNTGFVKDVIEKLPDPKPAYNTVSTIIRILEQKGFIDHMPYGKTHQYFPKVTKEEYRKFVTEKLMNGYFENSVGDLVSFFVKQQQIDLKEADEILKMIEEMKKAK